MSGKDGYTVADCMCGGGGSTTGIRRFFEEDRVRVKRFVAVNHDKDAIQVHEWNHPSVVHFCEDFGAINLHEAFPDGRCDFSWASTSCTQHSRARGGRPIEDQLRNGPWQLLTMATEIYVARWAIENVPEFRDWSPLDSKGRPMKSRRGETFREWKNAMERAGDYKFEMRIDNAADFGGGTTRERLIMLLVKKRGRMVNINWAQPTHSQHGDHSPGLFGDKREPWRGAREFLDFTLPSKPIVGRKMPLSPPTLARGWHGVRTFWGSAARSFAPDIRDAAIAGHAYAVTALAKAQDGAKPARLRKNGKAMKVPKRSAAALAKARARTAKRIERLQKMIERYVVLVDDVRTYLAAPVTASGGVFQPFLVSLRGTSISQVSSTSTTLDQPAPTVSAGGGHAGMYDGRLTSLVGGNRSNNVPKPDSEPTAAITTGYGGGLFMVTPIARPLLLGQHGGGLARPAEMPTNSPATSCATSVIVPIVSPFYGDKKGKSRASRTVDAPLGTPCTEPRFALLEGFIIPPSSESPVRATDVPLFTPTTTQRGAQFVEPVIVTVNHSSDDPPSSHVSTMDQTIPGRTQKNGEGVVEPFLVAHYGERDGQIPRTHSIEDPTPSPTHRGAGDLIQAALARVDEIDPALHERLLIGEDGLIYVAHLHFRMLNPTIELSRVMGFPATYKWPDSNVIVTKLVGNAVHVDWAYAIAKAFLGDWSRANADDAAA